MLFEVNLLAEDTSIRPNEARYRRMRPKSSCEAFDVWLSGRLEAKVMKRFKFPPTRMIETWRCCESSQRS
jgi:hypothetical protein